MPSWRTRPKRGGQRWMSWGHSRHRRTCVRTPGCGWASICLLADRIGALSQRAGFVVAPPPEQSPVAGLTPREIEVLQLVAAGRSNGEIGTALFISTKTASVHVSNILAKLGVNGRGEAAAIAHRIGLTES
jgi:DNA-binding CsgD family transcriptional regulator